MIVHARHRSEADLLTLQLPAARRLYLPRQPMKGEPVSIRPWNGNWQNPQALGYKNRSTMLVCAPVHHGANLTGGYIVGVLQ